MSVNPIPEGYHSVTPYLSVRNAARALDWYKKALGATELFRFEDKGKIAHAEIKVGDSILMLSDEAPEWNHLSPESLGGSPIGLHIYVDDVDSAFARAVDAGARQERAVEDQFYGDRTGTFLDPFGHRWSMATHVQDVPIEELNERMQQPMPQPASPQPA